VLHFHLCMGFTCACPCPFSCTEHPRLSRSGAARMVHGSSKPGTASLSAWLHSPFVAVNPDSAEALVQQAGVVIGTVTVFLILDMRKHCPRASAVSGVGGWVTAHTALVQDVAAVALARFFRTSYWCLLTSRPQKQWTPPLTAITCDRGTWRDSRCVSWRPRL